MFTNENCNDPWMKMNWNFPIVYILKWNFQTKISAGEQLEINGCKKNYKYLVG